MWIYSTVVVIVTSGGLGYMATKAFAAWGRKHLPDPAVASRQRLEHQLLARDNDPTVNVKLPVFIDHNRRPARYAAARWAPVTPIARKEVTSGRSD